MSGSPARVNVFDPSLVSVTGDGIVRAIKGEDTRFQVNAKDIGGNITVKIDGMCSECGKLVSDFFGIVVCKIFIF